MPDAVQGQNLDGGLTRGHVGYRQSKAPIVVHCCHCGWCQCESGSGFAADAVIAEG